MNYNIPNLAIIEEHPEANSKKIVFFVRKEVNAIISINPASFKCSEHFISFGNGYLFFKYSFIINFF